MAISVGSEVKVVASDGYKFSGHGWVTGHDDGDNVVVFPPYSRPYGKGDYYFPDSELEVIREAVVEVEPKRVIRWNVVAAIALPACFIVAAWLDFLWQ